jgi:RND superfamily putative drug exporter
VFAVDPACPLLSLLPIIVIGVHFGLSMDYEMLLASGMREQHSRGLSPREAVVGGFAQNAKVVAPAALIMIGVFDTGVYTSSTVIKPIAFALAVGVLIDAFVLRMTLVPTVMTLFGRHAWWLSRWMERALQNLEGASINRESEKVAVS